MSDQSTEYTPGMLSTPPAPDHTPGQQSSAMVRRKTAGILSVGALVLGGVLGGTIVGYIGSAAVAEAEVTAADEGSDYRARIQSLKDDAATDADTLKTLEAEVEELENAPALLAEQRKAEEAAAKKEAEEKKATEEAVAKKKAEEEAEKKAEAERAARTFPGDGTFVVGEDIKPGRYKADAAPSSFMANCYWARLSGTSGSFGEIITNHNSQGPTTVTILPSDTAFETNGCTTWERVE